MSKKSQLLRYISVVVLAAICLVSLSVALFGVAYAEDSLTDLYWSESNAPVFYGTTEITFSLGAVDEFDINDARFRIFAKDFEDGDLTGSIVVKQNTVVANKAGSYVVVYAVIDSHGNATEQNVNVTVVDDGLNQITVKRALYTLPNDWNMQAAGFTRCNTGDRQMLGIYLPHGAFFKMRVLTDVANTNSSATSYLTVSMLNDDSKRESEQRVNYYQDDQAYSLVSNNIASGVSGSEVIPNDDANVPFVFTSELARGNDINTVYEIELQYDATAVRPLNYYHYGDFGGGETGEQAFFDKWQASGDSHGVVENAALTVVVPFGDMETLRNFARVSNSNFTQTLDEFLQYYQKVLHKMDQIVGLKYNTDNPYDQNFRAKYLVKANAHGAGAAYYSGNHVGINSRITQKVTCDDGVERTLVVRGQMYSFFQTNWGGLHELAHGYQGSLGGNLSLGLGEVSNNILCHYIQMDDSIWTADGYWLGKLEDIENVKNIYRVNDGLDYFHQPDADALSTRLYVLINLFDSFEGEVTYAKLFSWFREMRAKGVISDSTPQQDVYTLFFADVYDSDIMPYWSAWGVAVSEGIKEQVAQCGKTFSILQDTAGTATQSILDGEGLSLKYGLVSDALFEKYDVTGSLQIQLNIDNVSRLNGRTVLLEKNGAIVAQTTVVDGKAEFRGIYAGSYLVRVPVLDEYTSTLCYVAVVANSKTTAGVTYNRVGATYHPTMIKIRGIYDTVGYTLALSNNNLTGVVSLGGANLGNQTDEWKAKEDEVFASVAVKDNLGNVISYYDAKGAGYFSTTNYTAETLTLQYGYTVEVYTHAAQYLKVVSLLTNAAIDAYNPTTRDDNTYIFVVTQDGLMPQYKQEFDVKSVLYDSAKYTYLAELAELESYFEANPESLAAKYYDTIKKQAFMSAYNALSEDDRAQYDQLATLILQGGKPVVTAKQSPIVLEEADYPLFWEKYIEIFDAEDGTIDIYASNVNIDYNSYNAKPGNYVAIVTVTDSDGNTTVQEIGFTVRFSVEDWKVVERYGMDSIKAFFEEHPDLLGNKTLERDKKDSFEQGFESLSAEGRTEFSELYLRMIRGGTPTITSTLPAVFDYAYEFDWNTFFTVTDPEQGKITLTSSNATTDFDFVSAGEFTVTVTVTDEDGNEVSLTVAFTVRYTEVVWNQLNRFAELLDYFNDNPDVLDNKNEDVEIKTEFKTLYAQLGDVFDQEQCAVYDELVDHINRGGSPILTLTQDVVTLDAPQKVDWTKYLTATDNEDGDITLVLGSNLIVETDYDGIRTGEFDVTFTVNDKDNNRTSVKLKLIVKDPTQQGDDNPTDPTPDVPTPPDNSNTLSTVIVLCVALVAVVAVVAAIVLIISKRNS